MKSPSSLSSQEVVVSAINTESRYAKWHQELARRFRPFDRSLSCLFEALAEEDQKNKQELLKLACQTIDQVSAAAATDSESEKPHLPPGEDGERHFFVVNERMATALLDAAIHFECVAQRFYERCCFMEQQPLLRALYKHLSVLEKQHAQVLEESRERFHTESDLRLSRSLA